MTKAQFARSLSRDPAFVSRAIAAGKLSGAALVGEGPHQRIHVAEARRQLGMVLDLGQQLAQAKPILPAAEPVLPLATPAPAPAGDGDGLHGEREEQVRLRNEKLRRDVQRMEIDMKRQAGGLVEVAAVQAALMRQLAPLASAFDELVVAVAKELAAQHGLPFAEVLISVKRATRTQREAWAARARSIAESRVGVPA